MVKNAVAKGGLLAAAVAGIAIAIPATADAAPAVAHPGNPTGQYYPSYDACEAEAAVVRDGTTGAWCTWDWGHFAWELNVSGS